MTDDHETCAHKPCPNSPKNMAVSIYGMHHPYNLVPFYLCNAQ